MATFSNVLSLLSGRKKIVIWAITTACNCRCRMCNMWKKKPVIVKDYKKLIDFMKKNKVLVLSLTGGEPMLHPNLLEIIRYAKSKGFMVHMATNGTLLTLEKAKALKIAGLDIISFSIDHYTPAVQDNLRRHKGAFNKVLNAVKIVKEAGIPFSTSTVVTLFNYKNIDKVIRFVDKKLDTSFTLCTPHNSPDSAFFEENSKEVSFTSSEMIRVTEKIIEMKKKGYNVSNSEEFLLDYINSLKGKSNYACQGGSFVYYLEVNGEFYPCFNKKKVFDMKTGWKTDKTGCYDCSIQCFKEPSVVNQLNPIKLAGFIFETIKRTKL